MVERFDTLLSPGQDHGMDVEHGERPCLTNDELLAFAQGRMGRHELRAVHAHADDCPACQHLLAEAVHAVAAEPTPDSSSQEWNTTFFPNAIVAQRYRIQRFVARGGMGEVYEAHDCDLGERVALKAVISTACDNPRAVQYLRREVQLNHRVSHPNVCRIFDLNSHTLETTGTVVHFLTMEFVEGVPLGARLRAEGPLPVAEATRIARELLLGLRAAHNAGILHRDFKSDNIILRTSTSGQVLPVILDFGLARCFEGETRMPHSGRNGGLVGTPSYMAPEQIEGRSLSPASDLYALGVVWFEMLTGELPFKTEPASANPLERLHRAPPAPSSVNPAIPRALDNLVLRCLSRRVEDRLQSADDVLNALDTLPGFRPHREWNARVWVAIGALLCVLGAGAWSVHQQAASRFGNAGRASRTWIEAGSLGTPRATSPLPPPPTPLGDVPETDDVGTEKKNALEVAQQPSGRASAAGPPPWPPPWPQHSPPQGRPHIAGSLEPARVTPPKAAVEKPSFHAPVLAPPPTPSAATGSSNPERPSDAEPRAKAEAERPPATPSAGVATSNAPSTSASGSADPTPTDSRSGRRTLYGSPDWEDPWRHRSTTKTHAPAPGPRDPKRE